MLEELKNIEDLVFVGGFAMHKLGLKESYSDLDIVVINKDFLKGVTWYETDSAFSGTGIRGFLFDGEIKLDIFLENKLPEFEIINGFKIQTKKSMREYYEKIYNFVKEYWKKDIENKLKLLQ